MKAVDCSVDSGAGPTGRHGAAGDETVDECRVMARFPIQANQAKPPLTVPHEKGPWWAWGVPVVWTLLGVFVLHAFHELREQTRNRLGLVATRQAIRRELALDRLFTATGGFFTPSAAASTNALGQVPEASDGEPRRLAVLRQRPIHPSSWGAHLPELREANRTVVSRLVGAPDAPEPYRPDQWEAQGSAYLQAGNKEWSQAVPMGEWEHYRLMRGLVAGPTCARCHQDRQWAEGEVVGAISVSLDLAPLDHRLANQWETERNVVAAVWALGLVAFGGAMRHASRRRRQRLLLWREAEIARQRFQGLFETAPASLWEEDFSEVKRRLEELQRSGVRDLRAHFDEHPGTLLELTRLLRVRAVNQTTLQTFDVKNAEELMASLDRHFQGRGLEVFREIVLALAAGGTRVEQEVPIPVHGQEKTFLLRVTVLPGAEETWERLLVAFLDITERQRGIEVLKRLATSDGALAGRDFFEAVCRHFVDATGVDAALVARFQEDGTSVTLLGGVESCRCDPAEDI